MIRSIYILFMVAIAILGGCQRFDEDAVETEAGLDLVEVLEDGRMKITGSFSVNSMADVSVSSRATDDAEKYDAAEKTIKSGWCLVFGEDNDSTTDSYSESSPLLIREELSINENGTFFVTLPRYEGVAYIRFVTNLSERENDNLSSDDVSAWGDNEAHYTTDNEGYRLLKEMEEDDFGDGYAIFGDYIYQSVGLDGIYNITYNTEMEYTTDDDGNITGMETVTDDDGNIIATGVSATTSVNTNAPEPEKINDAFPMSSIGFVMENGISVDALSEVFAQTIDMVRVCSKVTVTISESAAFDVTEIYLLDCAQESRIRSTVLSSSGNDGTDVTTDADGNYTFSIPVNLGGTIDYEPLSYPDTLKRGETSTPIYIYPNSGGDYDSNNGAVNQSVNPQYIVVKGRADGYDTDGYYKIALKAQYPMAYNDDGSVSVLSDLTYDILRNTHFNVNITMVDKPGYKTLADAASEDNPASNISYSITIMSDDSRNEILVSNGTYYVELHTTRVYMAGYGTDGNSGSIKFTVYPNSSDEGYQHPAIYVMADYGVSVDSCYANGAEIKETSITSDDDIHEYWYKVDEFTVDTEKGIYKNEIVVNYTAKWSGRVRLRIGDMLKFIPVYYDNSTLFDNYVETVVIGEENDFSYEEIRYLSLDTNSSEYDNIIENPGTDYSWFTEDGKIVAMSSDDEDREMRAMIYPVSGDGVTKLYFCQEYKNMDKKDENNDNVLDLEETYNSDSDSDSTATATEIAGETVVDMLDSGYTTIYFEGVDKSTDGLDLEAVLNYVEANYDGLYSVDISEVTLAITDGEFKGKSYSIFQGNDNLVSVVMPSSIIDIKEETFLNCTNLQFVTFGSVDDPSESFKTTGTLLKGCTSMIALTIYTKATSVKQSAMNESTTYFKTEHTFTTATTNNVKEIVYADGTSASSYVYVFCDDTNTNATTNISDLKTYFKTYNMTNETYEFNADLYTIYTTN